MTGEEAASARRPGGGRTPEVSVTSLHSYLVTRHTGRAVRASIRERIVASSGPLVAVLDFEDVAVIDFSCADEVVAKLIREIRGREGASETYFFFRGLDAHHLDPVESALVRRSLAVAGEGVGGDPMLVGDVAGEDRAAWRAVQRLGRAPAPDVARDVDGPLEDVRVRLDRLSRRRLVVAADREYVSLRRTLRDADGGEEPARGDDGP